MKSNIQINLLAKNAIKSLTNIAKSGFKTVDDETLNNRKSICNACEFWQPQGNLGFGKCKKCGCTKYKQNFVTEKCPLEKW